MKEIIDEQLQKVLDIYNDPDEAYLIVSQQDFQGHDCFWYLDEYNLYNILNCRIMDQIIKKKWMGKHDINSSILDYSTLSNIMFDPH